MGYDCCLNSPQEEIEITNLSKRKVKLINSNHNSLLNIHLIEENENEKINFNKYFTELIGQKLGNVYNNDGKQIIKLNLSNHLKGEITKDKILNLFNKIKSKSDFFCEVLIISIKKNIEEKLKILFNDLNLFKKEEVQPFIVLIINDTEKISKFLISENIQKKYDNIDWRNFSLIDKTSLIESIETPRRENKKIINNNTNEVLLENILRFSSYYNELGDLYLDNENKNIKENQKDTPSFYNILCIGRSQVGKSTLVNTILGVKKAREGVSGISVTTKKINKYRIKNYPINIFDIPGFSCNKDISNALNKIKEIKTNLQLIKEELHLIIYVMKYNQSPIFDTKEICLLEELAKDNTKIIFVITHSKINPNQIKIGNNVLINKIQNQIERINLSFKKLFFENYQPKEEEKILLNKIILKSFYNKTRMLKNEIKENIENIDYYLIIDNIVDNEAVCFVNFFKDTSDAVDVSKFGKEGLIHKIVEKINDKIIPSNNNSNPNKLTNNDIINSNIISENENTNLVNINGDSFSCNKNQYFNNSYNKELELIKIKADKLRQKAQDEVTKYIAGSAAIGVIPVVDLIAQHYIKEGGINEIAKIFGLDEKIQEINDEKIEEIMKEKTQDFTSDTLKTGGRVVTLGGNVINISSKVLLTGISNTARVVGGVFLAVAGVVVGTVTGGVIMKDDLYKVIDIYYEKYLFEYTFQLTLQRALDYFKRLETKYKEKNE